MIAVAPLPGMPIVEQRHQRPADRGGGRRLGRDDALGGAGAQRLRGSCRTGSPAVGDEGRDGGARARARCPRRCPSRCRARTVAFIASMLGEARERRPERAAPAPLSPRLRREPGAHAREHLADAVGAHHHQQELDAVLQERLAEGEALGAVDRVDADGRDEQPEAQADQRVDERSCPRASPRSPGRRTRSRRTPATRSASAMLRHRLGEQHHHDRRDQAAHESGHERPAERQRRLAPSSPSRSRPRAAARPSARPGCGTGSR